MFGGGNDNVVVTPTDHHDDLPVEGALADAPTNGLTPGDAPAQPYDAAAFGTSPNTAVAAEELATATTAPVVAAPDDVASQPAAATPAAPADDLLTSVPDDLVSIKQQALQQLSPLVGHLDQSPEEKFRTTMMMIQASDNADLVKDAYAAAQQIPDEKARAQALLDVVNEINYFTQHHDQQQ